MGEITELRNIKDTNIHGHLVLYRYIVGVVEGMSFSMIVSVWYCSENERFFSSIVGKDQNLGVMNCEEMTFGISRNFVEHVLCH